MVLCKGWDHKNSWQKLMAWYGLLWTWYGHHWMLMEDESETELTLQMVKQIICSSDGEALKSNDLKLFDG